MTVKLTEAAAAEASKYLENTGEKYLRVGVKGGAVLALNTTSP